MSLIFFLFFFLGAAVVVVVAAVDIAGFAAAVDAVIAGIAVESVLRLISWPDDVTITLGVLWSVVAAALFVAGPIGYTLAVGSGTVWATPFSTLTGYGCCTTITSGLSVPLSCAAWCSVVDGEVSGGAGLYTGSKLVGWILKDESNKTKLSGPLFVQTLCCLGAC